MAELVRKLEIVLKRNQLTLPGERILVAVSGGLDSMVLLQLCTELSNPFGWKLHIAHFNHGLRGAESDGDEALVEETARKLDLPFHRGARKVKQRSRQGKISIEMAARELRREFLLETARSAGCSCVFLAHHAQDQLELFFLRALRGSGVTGLAGMSLVTSSGKNPKVQLVRPLLEFAREELVDFATEQKIMFREDASNRDDSFLRNRLRHNILPAWAAQFGPAALQTPLRSMEILREVKNYLEQELTHWRLNPDRMSFTRLHPALQREWLCQQFIALGIPPTFDFVERALSQPGKCFSVGDQLLYLDSGGILRSKAESHFNANFLELKLRRPSGKAAFDGLECKWRFRPNEGNDVTSRSNSEVFDSIKIGECITLRHWRKGDRFQPLGMSSPVKLQDLFTNAKIPRQERMELVVATTETGEIFWVERLRPGNDFRVRNGTTERLVWTWASQRTESSQPQRWTKA